MTILKKLWYLFLTAKPLHHFSGQWATIAGLMVAWNSINTQQTTVFIEICLFVAFYSAIYQMNELIDLSRDKADTVRQSRPLAAGKVSKKAVFISMLVLGTSTGIALTVIRYQVLPLLVGLAIINLIYVGTLKRIPYFDIAFVSLTHVLKFFIGYILVTTTAIPTGLYFVPIFLYFITLAVHANKKIGRIMFHPGITKRFGDLRVFIYMRFLFLSLGTLVLLITTSVVHLYMWTYTVLFTLYTFLPDAQRLFYRYQRWYSRL